MNKSKFYTSIGAKTKIEDEIEIAASYLGLIQLFIFDLKFKVL